MVIVGAVHGCIAIPNVLDEVMPRVESKIDARFAAHEARSHPSTESAFLKIAERLSRIEAKLEDAIGRRAGVRAGE